MNNDLADPYIVFKPTLDEQTPKDIMDMAYCIKTKSEWETLGFKFKIDKSGNCKASRNRKSVFGFHSYFYLNSEKVEAINKNKRLNPGLVDLYNFFKNGYSFDEFLSINSQSKLYCESTFHHEKNMNDIAQLKIKEALVLENNNRKFKDLYFAINLELKNIIVFDEFFKYYENDLDGVMHSGELKDWLKMIYSQKEYDMVHCYIMQIKVQIKRLINKEITHNIFIHQDIKFTVYTWDKFEKSIEYLRERLKKKLCF